MQHPTFMVSTFSFLMFIFSICDSEWIQSSSTMPWGDSSQSIGSYNNLIHILGGFDTRWLIEYDISNGEFTDRGEVLATHSWGLSDFYTQIDNTLFIIFSRHLQANDRTGTGEKLVTYNLETGSMNTNYQTIPISVTDCGCLASTTDHLFVVGGQDWSLTGTKNTVQVFDISNNQWLDNVPSMIKARRGHSCIVDPVHHKLFAIGGFRRTGGTSKDPVDVYTATIETIHTDDITQNGWAYIEPLSIAIGWIRSVYFDQFIYVIGGAYGTWMNFGFTDKVHVIDTTTDTVTVHPDRLAYEVSSTASIIANNVLFVFGGYDGKDGYNSLAKWMYYQLPTTTTSTSTSAMPSKKPSDKPSKAPSNKPSYRPSDAPSNRPSDTPSHRPSNVPSNRPSNVPSNRPSDASSYRPSDAPLDKPSDAPSNKPSDAASNKPSDAPSYTSSNAPSIKLSKTTSK
eukprot:215633_1